MMGSTVISLTFTTWNMDKSVVLIKLSDFVILYEWHMQFLFLMTSFGNIEY